jgi:hypothetical protein
LHAKGSIYLLHFFTNYTFVYRSNTYLFQLHITINFKGIKEPCNLICHNYNWRTFLYNVAYYSWDILFSNLVIDIE